MVTLLDDQQLLDGDDSAPTVGAAVPEDADFPTETEILPIPRSQYRKSRFPDRSLARLPGSGGDPLQPAQQLVPGPEINFIVSDTNVTYQWTGFFTFDNAEYDFNISAVNKFRVSLDSEIIIDDFNSGARRTRIERIEVTAGSHQVTIEWSPNGSNSINFNYTQVAVKRWVSCDDGLEREGDPPEGWIKTVTGCFKPPRGDDDTAIDLLDVVEILPGADTRIERAYVKGSGTALSPHRLKFFNRSTNMTVNVALGGPKPVRFVTAFQFVGDVGVGGLPANSFELATQQEKEIDVLFIPNELDPLPEALIRSDILVALSAGTITIIKDGDDGIDTGAPLPPGEPIPLPPEDPVLPPPPPPPTPTWRDCSSGTEVVRDGFPPNDFILRSDGCYIAPPPPEPEITLRIIQQELAPRFTGTRSIGRASLRASLVGDDPTTFTYAWNFDVNRQGAGTGNTTIQNTTANWLMTDLDLIRLEDSRDAKTSRVVEVIARKGTRVIRSRITVILDNPELVFILPPEEFPTEPEPTEPPPGPGGGGPPPGEGTEFF